MGRCVYDVIVMHSHMCMHQQMSITEVWSQSNIWISERWDRTKSFIKSNFWRISKSL